MIPKYPVYVISKGRSDCCLTARFLEEDKVPYYLVVEPQEVDAYAREFPRERLLQLPFSNLGLGSIPARNFCWEHSVELSHERHWILDDNMRRVHRRFRAQRFRCDSGPAMRAMETFVDRYENIAIAGPNYMMFAPGYRYFPPFFQNVHVYSFILIRNDLPFRWRGRYNEDTDLCLQALASGQCTVQFQAFLTEKMQTMSMKGGNMTSLYQGDGRLKMARALELMWPGVVRTVRRFKRPQHYVDWRKFDMPLKRRADVDFSKLKEVDEFGLEMRAIGEVKGDRLKEIHASTKKKSRGHQLHRSKTKSV